MTFGKILLSNSKTAPTPPRGQSLGEGCRKVLERYAPPFLPPYRGANNSVPAATVTGMGDRLRAGKPPSYFTKSPRSTQPPTLRGTANECRSNCDDGSFHVWINMWVAGKTVGSLVNTCHT